MRGFLPKFNQSTLALYRFWAWRRILENMTGSRFSGALAVPAITRDNEAVRSIDDDGDYYKRFTEVEVPWIGTTASK